jgi:hypothetical protein
VGRGGGGVGWGGVGWGGVGWAGVGWGVFRRLSVVGRGGGGGGGGLPSPPKKISGQMRAPSGPTVGRQTAINKVVRKGPEVVKKR